MDRKHSIVSAPHNRRRHRTSVYDAGYFSGTNFDRPKSHRLSACDDKVFGPILAQVICIGLGQGYTDLRCQFGWDGGMGMGGTAVWIYTLYYRIISLFTRWAQRWGFLKAMI